jgi:hypothetical protein
MTFRMVARGWLGTSREFRWLVTALAFLFIGSVVILLLFLREAQVNTIRFEIAKALLQFGVIAVIGAVVSLLMFEYQRVREVLDKERELNRKNFEYREDLLKSILVRAMDAYSAVKKARRLLRARAIVKGGAPPEILLAGPYDVYLEMINDAQLKLENLARDIETSAPAFTAPEALEKNVWAMESYLGKLLKEYETSRRMFEGETPSLALTALPLLEEFTGPSGDSRFKEEVVRPYHEVQRGIRADLLHPNLPRGSFAPA